MKASPRTAQRLRSHDEPESRHPWCAAKVAIAATKLLLVGIRLSHRIDRPVLDGAASLLIGVVLAAVAPLLRWQSRDLLIGEAIRPETARALRGMALAVPGVRNVGRILSMYMGPDDALVTMDLDFDEGTAAADSAPAIAEIEQQVRTRFPMIRRLFIESGSVPLQQRWSRPDAIRPPVEQATPPETPARAAS